VGPWLGPGKVNGIVLALEGHAKPYVIFRDAQVCKYPAGLTQPGDRVSMSVRPSPEFYRVHLSAFRNHSLEETMPLLARDRSPVVTPGQASSTDDNGPTDNEAPLAAMTNVRSLRLVHNKASNQP
jgi:hypothetical protein